MMIALIRKAFALLLLSSGLIGCSALMPTRDIPSKDAAGDYPAIGAVPQGETKTLSEEERQKLMKDLTAAGEKNRRAAATPISKQVP